MYHSICLCLGSPKATSGFVWTRDRSLSIGNGGWGGLSIHLDFIRERSWITLTKSRGLEDGWLEDMWINCNHLIEGYELLKIRTVSRPTIWCLQVLLCPGFYYAETKILIHRPRLDRAYFTDPWLVLVLSLDVSYFSILPRSKRLKYIVVIVFQSEVFLFLIFNYLNTRDVLERRPQYPLGRHKGGLSSETSGPSRLNYFLWVKRKFLFVDSLYVLFETLG